MLDTYELQLYPKYLEWQQKWYHQLWDFFRIGLVIGIVLTSFSEYQAYYQYLWGAWMMNQGISDILQKFIWVRQESSSYISINLPSFITWIVEPLILIVQTMGVLMILPLSGTHQADFIGLSNAILGVFLLLGVNLFLLVPCVNWPWAEDIVDRISVNPQGNRIYFSGVVLLIVLSITQDLEEKYPKVIFWYFLIGPAWGALKLLLYIFIGCRTEGYPRPLRYYHTSSLLRLGIEMFTGLLMTYLGDQLNRGTEPEFRYWGPGAGGALLLLLIRLSLPWWSYCSLKKESLPSP